LKPPFCSGLKKSHNLLRNLNQQTKYIHQIFSDQNLTIHKHRLELDLLVLENP
jgi:hypothetical protein